jgi:hypothetical protein
MAMPRHVVASLVGPALAVLRSVVSIRAKCCFTYLTRTDCVWRDPNYSVKKFIDAIKGRPISDYAYLRIRSGEPLQQLEQANAGDAVQWFGEMAAELVFDEQLVHPILVPFPNSRCTLDRPEPPRTMLLAAAIARHLVGHDAATPAARTTVARASAASTAFGNPFVGCATVADVLRFDRAVASAHTEGGAREPAGIYRQLRLIGSIDVSRPYVLVDDVLASGGHLRAGAAFLRAHGADVQLAVCAVSAEAEPVADPFARVCRELPDFRGFTNFGELPRVSGGLAGDSSNPFVDIALEPGDRVRRNPAMPWELANTLQAPDRGP